MNRYTAASTLNALVTSPFSRIFVDDDADGNGVKNDGCVIYAYDRTGGTPGTVELARGEIRALRLAFRPFDGQTVGVLEIAESAGTITPRCDGDEPSYSNYPPTCSNDGWCALTDPRVINITNFSLDTSGYIVQAGTATSTPMTIREIGIGLDGQLRQSADGTVTRGISSRVKVRADCLEASANCALPPTGT